jgi:hypothetical protein
VRRDTNSLCFFLLIVIDILRQSSAPLLGERRTASWLFLRRWAASPLLQCLPLPAEPIGGFVILTKNGSWRRGNSARAVINERAPYDFPLGGPADWNILDHGSGAVGKRPISALDHMCAGALNTFSKRQPGVRRTLLAPQCTSRLHAMKVA